MRIAAARLGAQQLIDVLADLVHVDELLCWRARRDRHRVDQCVSRSASLMMTCVYSLQRRGRQLALEQLRRAAQAAERVFDLVRELPDHQAAAVEPRQQIVFARDALPLRGVGKLEQQLRAR